MIPVERRPVFRILNRLRLSGRDRRSRLQPQTFNLALPRPVISGCDKGTTRRILADIIPLLAIAFFGSQDVVEELCLPELSFDVRLRTNAFARPLFPKLHESG